jgi:endonuclease G
MPNASRYASRTRLFILFITALFGISILFQQMYFARRVQAISTTVVISEFRTRGPNGAADEFVELYNVSNSPVDISGWKINGSNNAAVISTRLTIAASTTIPAHGHFLATNSSTSGGPYSGSVLGNQTFTTGITDDGGIALLTGANVVIDQVGMSAGSAYKEGTTLAPMTTTGFNQGYERKPGGSSGSTQDTDNNGNDFKVTAPSDPQNLSSTPTPSGTNQPIVPTCPASLSTDQGTAASTGVSATDPDGTVTSASITSGAVAGISLDSFAAAGGLGGTATATLNVANTTAAGSYSVVIQYSNNDPTPQSASCTVNVTVNAPTPPTGVGAASPNSVAAGGSSLLTVTVTPGTHPTSTGISVSGDLSSIGGSATQVFSDSATDGDVTAGDNIFSFSAAVSEGTTAGLKTLPTTITDAQSRGGSASIALTVTSPTSNPTGTGAATPSSVAAGGMTLLTVTVTPGTGPTSTGIVVTGDLSNIGGVANQQFFDDGSQGDATAGDNVFSFNATVAPATVAGDKTLPFIITDAEARNGSGSISLAVRVPAGAVVISQVYGGGGNAGATLKNDFIEIFNRSSATVDLSGWSVQYASAAATTAWGRTPLTGTLAPGQYYLIQEAAGAGGSVDLPTPDVVGSIAMSATNANIALVSNNVTLATGCPGGNPQLIDLVGYGTAACFEGSAATPGLTNTTADVRKRGGCKDTDDNLQDFIQSSPNPRNSSTAVSACPTSGDLSPVVESVSPANGAPGIDNNSNLTVTFDEPVTVSSNWIQISCASSGLHTATTTGGPTTFTIDPDIDFGGAEQCIVTVLKNEVFDQDLVDPPDNMDADYIFAFMTAIARDPAEHMVMGNPSGAMIDENVPLNYLMMKKQYALSYNNDKGTSNWTSWHLDSTWTTGVADRQNDFRSDDTLPLSFKHVSNGYQFATYGFDRGHMCPSADRTSSIADNSATFLMTNMVPQASGNNQGPWGSMENYIRAQLGGSTNELYIVSGGTGVGGDSSTGHWDSIIDTAGNMVTVPHLTWKVVMVLPNSVEDDVARVDGSTRTFAVIMPNNDNIRSDQWQKYLATVDQVETISGFDFYSQVPAAVQDVFEAKLDTVNDTAPVTSNQSKTTEEDQNAAVTLSATDFNVNNTFTFTIVDQPLHGSVSCTDANCSYSPSANYFGPDSFTFKANDGALDSNVSTVNITVTEVNDAPVANNDSYSTNSNTALNIAAPGVLGNDTDIDADSLTSSVVIASGPSHGTLTLNLDGSFSYMPNTDYTGADGFSYTAYDGTVSSNAATVAITVNDTVGPYLNTSVAMSLITSTNSNLFNVGLAASATDNGGGSVTISVAVFGDEDDQTATLPGVVHSPDAKDIAPTTLRLRGERVEANDGRVYLIVITATDNQGNITRNYQTVVVPKNNKQVSISSVNAQAAAAVSYAQSHGGAPPPGYFVIGDGPIIGPKQ